MSKKKVGLVISDMSPNISGIASTDQARAMHLAELALDFAMRHLQPGGTFLVKVFQGTGFEDYIKLMRRHFAHVLTRKPDASRNRSSELYLLGKERIAKTGKTANFVKEASSAGKAKRLEGALE